MNEINTTSVEGISESLREAMDLAQKTAAEERGNRCFYLRSFVAATFNCLPFVLPL